MTDSNNGRRFTLVITIEYPAYDKMDACDEARKLVAKVSDEPGINLRWSLEENALKTKQTS